VTRKLSEYPIYPLLLAAYFPLYLMSADIGMTNLADVVRPLVVYVALALVATAVTARVLRDLHRAALWVAMAVIVIFDFRLLQQMIDRVFSFWIKELPGIYALAGMVAVAALIAWRARPGVNVTRIGNLVVAVMAAFPAFTLAQRALEINPAVAGGAEVERDDAAFAAVRTGGERPNIVHIVLDGYSRADVLARYYGFDNSGFLSGLKAAGFVVADHAASAYSQTLQSMTSIFTASQLNGVGGDRKGAELRDALRDRLKNNPVMGTLSRLGYQTAALDIPTIPFGWTNSTGCWTSIFSPISRSPDCGRRSSIQSP